VVTDSHSNQVCADCVDLPAVENASKEDIAMNPWPDDDVILYDGVCVFCSRWIRFIATRDVARRFRFTAIQSDYGTRLAQAFGIDPDDPDTNAVIHGGIAYFDTGFSGSMRSALCRMRGSGSG
jgi:DCC1-like thiol-disulfide oxidoreductase